MLRLDEKSERKLYEECPEIFGNKPPRRIKYRKNKAKGKPQAEGKPTVKLRGHGRKIVLRGKDEN